MPYNDPAPEGDANLGNIRKADLTNLHANLKQFSCVSSKREGGCVKQRQT